MGIEKFISLASRRGMVNYNRLLGIFAKMITGYNFKRFL